MENFSNPFARKIRSHQMYFHRVMSSFEEEDSNFKPRKNTLTVAGQVLHVVIGNEWFLSGMFGAYEGNTPLCKRESGFNDMDWIHIADERDLGVVLDAQKWPAAFAASTSITTALDLFDKSLASALELLTNKSVEDLQKAKFLKNPVMPDDYSYLDVIYLMIDHIAQHRGALVSYAHLLGKEPLFPYFDLSKAMLKLEAMKKAQ